MNRQEALALLKELIKQDLVDPTWVSVGERTPNDFQLQIKNAYQFQKLETFTHSRNLVIELNKNKGYLFIYKP